MRKIIYFAVLVLAIVSLAACHKKESRVPGQVEGEFSYINAPAKGKLIHLDAKRGEILKAGTPLFEMNIKNIKAAKANKGEIDQIDDDAMIDSSVAKEKQATIKASWKRHRLTVRAARNCLIYNTYYSNNSTVSKDSPVIALLTKQQIFIVFYVKEKQMEQLQLNDQVKVFSGVGNVPATATITYISFKPSELPISLSQSQDESKSFYRIEAIPDDCELMALIPGEAVEVSLNV